MTLDNEFLGLFLRNLLATLTMLFLVFLGCKNQQGTNFPKKKGHADTRIHNADW